ncbi:MAG: HNH endonuclease signature motif containing protein [Pseudomonadota bacterium]
MADQPPVFRPPGWKPRKPWQRRETYRDPRLRGRAGQRMRAQVLAEEPLCRVCLNEGKRVQATVVDHIKPLAFGGSESRSNKQALCQPCHDLKSKAEREAAQHGRGWVDL